MKKPLEGLLVFVFILLFALNGCESQDVSNEREIYIPIITEEAWLTADGAFLNGFLLAVEEVNREYAGKGYKIRTEVIDDKALYETGVEIATQVAQDPTVTAVINIQEFDVSKTTADILAGQGKLTLFPYGAYDSLFSGNNPLVFCPVPSFADLGRALAAYAIENDYGRIAIYHNGTQAQEELVTAFELAVLNSGSKVVDYVPSIISENDFESIYTRWQALGVDCLVISQYGQDKAFDVLKMLRGRDNKIAVLGEPVFNSTDALSKNKEISEGLAVSSSLELVDRVELTAFKDKYRLKYCQEADIWAVQGYDMLRLIVDTAVRLETNDPAKIAAALHDEEGYQGIGRHIIFTKGGAMATDIAKLPILICRNGKFEKGN